jgi:hypothetical protein
VKPQRVARVVRRAALLCAFLGALYLFARADTLRIPAGGCSPVLRYSPGDLLLLDARPPRLYPGDVVLFAAGGGATLYLGVVEREEPGGGRYWIVTDNPACPGLDSDDVGPIARAAVRGRALCALPW